ncbi:MAG: hypothetical protein HKN07_09185 [Acidimicrobiia bacterium]|nr:hypothetical protein [Acidimicrobiia bacterium]
MTTSRRGPGSPGQPAVPRTVRQAVVIVHGMGEQRPLDMLSKFITAALPDAHIPEGDVSFYSRPDPVSDSYESRRFLARGRTTPDGREAYAQTEFFEYHWAYLMEGNKFSDVFATLRKMILRRPKNVPSGLKGAWVLAWLLVIAVGLLAWRYVDVSGEDVWWHAILTGLLGGGLMTAAASWLFNSLLPKKITASFVDVVRYLDTSPRSYKVRKAIRKGMVDLLENLHDSNRYQRIIVVAHSLGAYVAYDGITFLWSKMNRRNCSNPDRALDPAAREVLEEACLFELSDPGNLETFRDAQRDLWTAFRAHGSPWLISDFITCGTPMTMADDLMTNNRDDFTNRVGLRHVATCPPQQDLPGLTEGQTYLTYPYKGATALYHAAPFAVVRWTNMWFPARWGLFGDWFGGPLRPLFGEGIKDIPLDQLQFGTKIPALAHTKYFSYPGDLREGSVTKVLHDAMALNSSEWLTPTLDFDCPEIPAAVSDQ